MQKLPEVLDSKKHDACVKKATSRHGEQAHSLSGSDRRIDNTLAELMTGTTHTFLDESLVSPFTQSQSSQLTACRNIKGYEMELRTKTTGLRQTTKATNHC